MVKNIEKYINDGWGLSKKCLLDINKCLEDFDKPIIVEFGSGISTEFFVDYLNENNKDGKISSFDDSIEYASKIKDDKLILNIKNIIEFNDEDYDLMFLEKKYFNNKKIKRKEKPHTRQKNCFYDINDELPSNIDLVVIDGPHGNGRNISFLHLKNKLHVGSYVIIDDFNHYDFCEKFEYIFPNYKIISKSMSGKIDQWNNGGNYIIYKIIN